MLSKPVRVTGWILLFLCGTWLTLAPQIVRAGSPEYEARNSAVASMPECRRIATPDIVMETAQLALEAMRARVRRAPGGVSAAIPDRIDVVLVDDALKNEVDGTGCRRSSTRAIAADTLMRLSIERPSKGTGTLDRWSVGGACRAIGSHIRCSATAIELILAKDESSSFSPTLLYVLGHEVAHLVLGHTGGSMVSTPRETDASSRLSDALSACGRNQDVMAEEIAADNRALEVLGQELSARGIADDRTFDGWRAIYSWLLWTPGMSASLERGKSFCHYLSSGPGDFALLDYRGSHPRWAARGGRLAARANSPNASYFNQSARSDDFWVERFCREARAFEARQFTCSDAGGPGSEEIVRVDDNTIMILREPTDGPIVADSQYEGDCSQNNPGACVALGAMFKMGLHQQDVIGFQKPDIVSARKYLSAGCEFGSALSCFETAVLFYEDLRVPRIYTLGLLAHACNGRVEPACQRYNEVMGIAEELRRTTGLAFSVLPFDNIPLR